MGRNPDPARRAQLRDAAVDYVLAHGLADLSLRPLAAAVGTSARILIYHFGSKEQLVAEALRGARRREQQLMATFWAGTPLEDPTLVMGRTWEWMTSPDNEPFLRLFFEVYGLALQDPGAYPGFLDHVVADWLKLFGSWLEDLGVDPRRAETLATAIVATSRGLLLDVLATGDRQRTDPVFGALTHQIERAVAESRPKSESAKADTADLR
jgi:AcrR family transcriptional regulator